MVPNLKLDPAISPVEMLDACLAEAWELLCTSYDLDMDLPDSHTLFANAPLTTPPKAAETVLINMLTEVIENIGRFSNWYKQPARAFGLISLHDPYTGTTRWLLAPESLQKWSRSLRNLSKAIKANNGLIQATLLVENLVNIDDEDRQVIACCECFPPKRIQIRPSVLDKTAIICDECQQAFA